MRNRIMIIIAISLAIAMAVYAQNYKPPLQQPPYYLGVSELKPTIILNFTAERGEVNIDGYFFNQSGILVFTEDQIELTTLQPKIYRFTPEFDLEDGGSYNFTV